MGRWRLVLGTAVSGACLALLFVRVDLPAVVEAARAARPAWLLLAVPLFAASIGLRAMRWRAILRPLVPLSRGDAAVLVLIGYAANNLLPARTGEVVRAVLLQRRHGVSAAAGLGTIVVERVLDGLVLALLLAGTLTLAGGTGPLRVLAGVAGTGFLGVALALVLLAARPALAWRVIDVALRAAPASLAGRARALIERFVEGLTLLRHARAWVYVVATSVAAWTLEAGAYWAIGEAFALPLAPALYLAVCAAANLAIAAPSTSGGIGPYEFFAREVVVHFGTSAAAGTAYALALHAFVLAPVTVAGILLLWRRHLGIATLATTRVPVEANA